MAKGLRTPTPPLSFPKIRSGRIRAVKENQSIIFCARLPACNLYRRSRHQLNTILRRPPQRLRPQLRPLLYTYTFSRAKIVISVVLDSSCTGCEPAPDHKPGPPGNAVPMM